MSHEELPEDLGRAVDELQAAARAVAERELAGAAPRPDFAEIVARAHRIDPQAVPYGWIDAARRGVAARSARPERGTRRTTILVIGVAAALVLALGLREGLRARPQAQDAGSLAGLLGAEEQRRAAESRKAPQRQAPEACPPGQAGCTRTGMAEGTCPQGQADCTGAAKATCPAGPVGCAEPGAAKATCPAGQTSCPASAACPDGQAGCTGPGTSPLQPAEGACPAGQVCPASCPAGAPGCPAANVELPEATCPKGQGRDCPGPRASGKRPARTGEGLTARLRRLDDEAEVMLRAGDLAGADERYVEIAAIGGTRPEVEHAFADRFGVARARRDVASQRLLWRAYLERFPRGSFADDARAGLCRGAPASEQARCWTDYLAEFPGGAHRREAEAGR